MKDDINKLIKEDISFKENCNLCKESNLKVGDKTDYGAIVIYKIGNFNEGWFATLSPKTGGNPKEDFTIQLMPFAHLTHFSQIYNYPELAKNYGITFSKINMSVTKIMAEENPNFKLTSDLRENSISIATYGKCTNWKEKKEHLHVKIFPFRGNIGQPYTVDSSFERKEIYKDLEISEEFVKMKPVRKSMINEKRFKELSNRFIELLK